ncbi:queuosine precursor transporter [Actinomyces culturomici]|uniref:queuosine precursor transporter n=1 Tax=Actinomyces culturomici TaxID=1926276 RepID=UPI000E200EF7|nr:queuosine precursor transporter [Actinomyces culturomici]
MTDTPDQSARAPRIFDVVAVMFVAFLLISNIAATKVTALDAGPIHLVFDGGAILFPLTYVLGDVLSEVYGFARARRVIILGFVASILASLTFLVVQVAPVGPGYENQAAFEAVLGFVPRIVAASVIGYLVGQLMNSLVLVKIRERWGADHMWARLVGSTVVGELFDTVLFCTIAFIGVIPGLDFLNYVVTGYVYKVGVEVVLLPITYRVIALVRAREGLAPQEVLAA